MYNGYINPRITFENKYSGVHRVLSHAQMHLRDNFQKAFIHLFLFHFVLLSFPPLSGRISFLSHGTIKQNSAPLLGLSSIRL